jgi:hypothetical protein
LFNKEKETQIYILKKGNNNNDNDNDNNGGWGGKAHHVPVTACSVLSGVSSTGCL